jgi:hypothetical protein
MPRFGTVADNTLAAKPFEPGNRPRLSMAAPVRIIPFSPAGRPVVA